MRSTKDSKKLMIGLGIGALIIGAAVAAYYLTHDNRGREMMDDIEDAVKKAKKRVKNAVESGIYELDEAAEKLGRMAKDTVRSVKSHI